jgi:Tol biopolymer transport system component
MDVDDPRPTEVGPPIDDAAGYWWIDWTADGRLLFTAANIGTGFQVIDPTGRKPVVTLATGYTVDAPVVRPGSNEVLFRGDRDFTLGLYVVTLDGSPPRALVGPRPSGNGGFELRESHYSPDGKLIAYHVWDPNPGSMHLYVMNADGTGKHEVGADPAISFTGWPVWSNDGTRVAVQRAKKVPAGESGSLPYAIIDVASGKVVETGPVLPSDGGHIEWAPDDSVLLMVPNDTTGRQLLLDPHGGPARTPAWTSPSYPSWQRLALP